MSTGLGDIGQSFSKVTPRAVSHKLDQAFEQACPVHCADGYVGFLDTDGFAGARAVCLKVTISGVRALVVIGACKCAKQRA